MRTALAGLRDIERLSVLKLAIDVQLVVKSKCEHSESISRVNSHRASDDERNQDDFNLQNIG